jgi:septal ring factor EnvC (AmiA/AmiB activator)
MKSINPLKVLLAKRATNDSALKSLLSKKDALDKQIAAAEKRLITEAESIEKASKKKAKKPAAKKPAKAKKPKAKKTSPKPPVKS